MRKLTASDVESTARRAGWAVSPERALQITASAAPRIEAFARIRATLTFEDDAAAFAAALLDTASDAGARA